MKKFFGLLATTCVLCACSSQEEITYDQNSWETMIPESCASFFDGCNNCNRTPGSAAACTRMFCEQYQEPKCLDDEQ